MLEDFGSLVRNGNIIKHEEARLHGLGLVCTRQMRAELEGRAMIAFRGGMPRIQDPLDQ